MGIVIKPSDLQFRYPKNKDDRELPKFTGKPDPNPFDRDDLYEIIPMFEAVMDAVGTNDGAVLHRMEELLNSEIPRFIHTREQVFDCLVSTVSGLMSPDGKA